MTWFATNGFRHVNMSEGKNTNECLQIQRMVRQFFLKDINDINNGTKDTTINQKATLRDARQAAWFYFC